MAAFVLLSLLAATAVADQFSNTPNCRTDTETAPNEFHYGSINGEEWEWIAARDGLVEGSVFQRMAPGTYEGDPGYGYYAMATCRWRSTDTGFGLSSSGYIGQALDPNDQYGSGLADLCLTASGVNESNLTVSLEKCAYENSDNNSPIATQNFLTRLQTLIFLGDQRDPPNTNNDKVDYKVRFDDDGTVRLDYEKGAYGIPDPYNDEGTFVIYVQSD